MPQVVVPRSSSGWPSQSLSRVVANLGHGTLERIADLGLTAGAVLDSVLADAEPASCCPEGFVGLTVAVVVLAVAELSHGTLHRIAGLGLPVHEFCTGAGRRLLRRSLSRGPRRSGRRSRCPGCRRAQPRRPAVDHRFVAGPESNCQQCGGKCRAAGRGAEVLWSAVAIVVQQIASLGYRALERIADLSQASHAVLDGVLADACTAGRRAEVLVGQAIAVVVLAVTGLGDCSFHGVAGLG